MRRAKRMVNLFVCLALLYVMILTITWFFEDRLLYHPPRGTFEDCQLPETADIVNTGHTRHLFTPSPASTGLVVFYHGNADNACNWRFLGVNHLAPLGYDTLVVGYPGYNGSPERATKKTWLETADEVRLWAEKHYENIHIMGYSMGTGPASHHAGAGKAASVMLFAPFDAMHKLIWSRGFLYPPTVLRNNYNNIASLTASHTPITIIYGAQDRLIPAIRAQRLAKMLKEGGKTVNIIRRDDLAHHGFFDNPEFDLLLKRQFRPIIE